MSILAMMMLGQLTRVNISPQIAFYWHDVAIVFFVLLTLPKYLVRMFRNPILYHKSIILSSLVVIFAVFSWYINRIYTITPLLYGGRLLAYVIFGWLLKKEKLFETKEWQQLLLIFFTGLAILGLGQYFCCPDTRFLEGMGWDDHYYRLIGTWFDPAFTALGLVLGWLWVHLVAKNGLLKLNKSWARKIELLLLLALILTYSRSGYLATGGCALLLLGQNKERRERVTNRKYWLGVVIAAVVASGIYSYLAWKHPSDSTNLLRTNSIVARTEMLQQQLQAFNGGQWLYGRGVFVPLKQTVPSDSLTSEMKKTAAFPDNFEILLVSFLGLPLMLGLCWLIVAKMLKWWQTGDERFYYAVATLVCAQFNQAVLQPFILLTLIMLENEHFSRDKS